MSNKVELGRDEEGAITKSEHDSLRGRERQTCKHPRDQSTATSMKKKYEKYNKNKYNIKI